MSLMDPGEKDSSSVIGLHRDSRVIK